MPQIFHKRAPNHTRAPNPMIMREEEHLKGDERGFFINGKVKSLFLIRKFKVLLASVSLSPYLRRVFINMHLVKAGNVTSTYERPHVSFYAN